MSKVKDSPQLTLDAAAAPEVVVAEPSAMVAPGITGADVNHEVGLIQHLSDRDTMERAVEAFELRARLIEQARSAAIRATSPEDWVLFQDKAGAVNAMLCGPGAQQVSLYYGIQCFNFRPQGRQGFEPQRIQGASSEYAFRGWCSARSAVTGQMIEDIEATRSSAEQFTGRSGAGHKTDLIAESDLRLSVSTLLKTKAARILAAMTRVPLRVLDDAWEGTTKKSDDCRKGSGFGSSTERSAERAADPGAKAGAAELGREILARVGGDEAAARNLCKEITANPPKFGGFDSVARLTKDWQIRNAWERLKAHEVFGDHAAKSEPGL